MRAFGSASFLAALIVASPLAAQSIDSLPSAPQGLAGTERPPAYVATLDGHATITRAGESAALDLHAPVIEGDRLRVDSGFVELRWDDGTSLFLDSRTTLDMVSIERMRLSEGEARFVAGRGAASGTWVIDTPAAEVRLDRAVDTLLVVDARSATQALEVFSLAGDVGVANDRGQATASQGESVRAEAFRAPVTGRGRVPTGGLLAWSDARLAEQRGAGPSQSPITRNGVVEYGDANQDAYAGEYVGGYADDPTLVRYGTWDRDPEYGAVWYPTASDSWRPYYYGRWESAGRYGYVWVGSDPWSYRTHHYGRWGQRSGRWFWIPGRTWASAWVSWAVGPGYVSWSPLGYDNRPVFGFNLSIGSTYNRGYGNRHDGWSGWTVVPSDRWRARGRVDRYAVTPQQLPVHVRSAFVTQSVAPNRGSLSRVGRDAYAVPRGGGGDTRDMLRQGGGPARADRNAPVYAPSPRRADQPATTPSARAQRYVDRRTVPQGAQLPRNTDPAGAVRRPSSNESAAGRPVYDPRPASPGIDNSRIEPRAYERRERPQADDTRPARPAYAPRDTPRSAPRSYEPREPAPRGDTGRSREYARPAPQSPRSGDEGGAAARQRDSGGSPGGRVSSPSGGDRPRSNRVPSQRPPRER